MLAWLSVYTIMAYQESGVKRDKTMADKLMYISNDDTQNYPFSRLQLVVEMFGHST